MNKLLIFFDVVFILGLFFYGHMHEQVHVSIFRSYGIDAEVNYISSFPDFTTVGEEPCPTESCNLAHNINEVVGYHLIVIYAIIGLGIILVINLLSILIEKIDDYE